MALNSGQTLAHYNIIEPIGKGGMGEVYRARDTKLGRDVAIKVLPEEFASDEDRLARFQREAKVLASLNHPGIAAIYGLEAVETTHYLVLELVAGETLAARIARGPLPMDEALDIAMQITEALEAAHERGVVHRDLKPANIMITPDGKVKVLDFGLAKAFAEETPESDGSMSPTLTRNQTRVGLILGTAAYMSPEQAKGRSVDKRTDIFAFGAVLYEMLTGKKTFPGDDVSEVLAAVIKLEPDWSALPGSVPTRLRELLTLCLEKDARKRRRDIGDVRNEIDRALAAPPAESGARQPTRHWPLVASGLLTLVAILFAVSMWNVRPVASTDVTRFAITLPEGESFSYVGRRVVAFSPRGDHIAYVANRMLNLRPLDRMEATPLQETEGTRTPFFSPDGQWIGFWSGNAMKKVAITGGTPQMLCRAEIPYGASWGTDGTIVYGQGSEGIWRVSSDGGEPERMADVEGSSRAYGPQILPGGRQLLFTLASGADWDLADIVAQSLETGERKVLVRGGSDGRYLPSGHLVYAVDSTLYALPLDLGRLETEGTPVPILEGVDRSTANGTGAAHFSVSDSGSLAFVTGMGSISLLSIDRSGEAEILSEGSGSVSRARFSPDGTRLAGRRRSPAALDVWILDLEHETLSRLTTAGVTDGLVWSPDGEWLVFGAEREEGVDLYRQAADFSGDAEVLLRRDSDQLPEAFSRDGEWLVFNEITSGGSELWALPLGSDSEVRLLSGSSQSATISPDGRFMAYQSDESGQDEVYVQPFPDGGTRVQLSTEGGRFPVWSTDGEEVFYESRQGLMRVGVTTSPDFRHERPSLLINFAGRGMVLTGGSGRNWDVSPDGERFVLNRAATDTARLNVVLNWFEELERLVPTDN